MDHFGRIRDHRPSSINLMQPIVAFAFVPRGARITLLRWEDMDGDRILVRDMKHPGDKKGNTCTVSSRPVLAIIRSLPRTEARYSPIQPTRSVPHLPANF